MLYSLCTSLSGCDAPVAENPSCLQATCASTVPQKSSHTVPHCPFRQTSTRPSLSLIPPTNLMPPTGQTEYNYKKVNYNQQFTHYSYIMVTWREWAKCSRLEFIECEMEWKSSSWTVHVSCKREFFLLNKPKRRLLWYKPVPLRSVQWYGFSLGMSHWPVC